MALYSDTVRVSKSAMLFMGGMYPKSSYFSLRIKFFNNQPVLVRVLLERDFFWLLSSTGAVRRKVLKSEGIKDVVSSAELVSGRASAMSVPDLNWANEALPRKRITKSSAASFFMSDAFEVFKRLITIIAEILRFASG